jgi:hypothetical protein
MIPVTGLSAACIGLLGKNLSIFSQINYKMLTFINQNFCVDGPLRYAFRVSEDTILYSARVQIAALVFIVIAFSIQLIALLFFTDFFYIWTFQFSINDLMV